LQRDWRRCSGLFGFWVHLVWHSTPRANYHVSSGGVEL
jgi:hypothetical protein